MSTSDSASSNKAPEEDIDGIQGFYKVRSKQDDKEGLGTDLSTSLSRGEDTASHHEPANDAEKGTPLGPMHPSQFPDGGLQAWLTVSGAFCALFVSFGWINCIGVFQDYYQRNFLSSYSSSEVAWIPSVETFVMLAEGPFVGRLYDAYGPRWILATGTFFHAFGLMMTSLSSKYYQIFLSQSICSPLGAGLIFYPSISAVSTWFFRKRAFALGITVAGSSLGGVIFPIMVERLVPEVGFGWAMRTCAFLIFFLSVIATLTVKSRIPPSPKPFRFMDFIDPLFEVPYLLTGIASFLYYFGMFIPFSYIILSGTANGMSQDLAGYLVPILNAASVIGRTLPPYLADKFGRYNTMVIVSYLSGILVLALWLPASANAPIILFAAFYGFATGSTISLQPALVAQISKIQQIGTRNGTIFFLNSIGALIGSPIAGALVKTNSDGQQTFTKLQIFVGVIIIGGSTVYAAARVAVGGFSMKKKV